MTKIPPKPKNYQNTPKTQKTTKIPLKPKNDQNTLKTQKLTKIALKPTKWPKYLQNLENEQNTPPKPLK